MKTVLKILRLKKLSKKCPQISKGTTPIFKLNVDCLEEIFDWLSVKDLHSFGQTCPWFRQVAGCYFRRTYQSLEVNNSKDGIYTEYSDIGQPSRHIYLPGFTQFIKSITQTYNNSKSLRCLKSTQLQYRSLNRISFMHVTLNRNRMGYIKSVLSEVEIVKMYDCRFQGDFYENFLKVCKQLKRLHLQDVDFKEYDNNVGCFDKTKGKANRWLLKKYPLLEHFQLTPRNWFIIEELKIFFEKNSTIRTFSTSSNCLFQNRVSLSETQAKLDILAVDLNYCSRTYLWYICNVIHELHQSGFFKKLHLYASYLDKQSSEQIRTLLTLETLYVKHLRQSDCLNFFTSIRELGIFEGSDVMDMQELARNLVEIERVYLEYGNSNDILAFVRYSPKLREIHVLWLREAIYLKQQILDLDVLDRERQKLSAARKVSIYVKENLFLTTKWKSNGRTNRKLVVLKRIESSTWQHSFEF